MRPAPAPRPEGTPVWEPLRRAAAYGWRLALLALLVVLAVKALAHVVVVVIPVVAALFLAALLEPEARRLRGRGVPAWAAALTCIVVALAAIGGAALLVLPAVADQFSQVRTSAGLGLERLAGLIADALPIDEADLREAFRQAIDSLRSSLATTTGLVGAARTVFVVVIGAFITLFALFFFLKDGRRFAGWSAGLAPRARQGEVRSLLARAWSTLEFYARGVVFVGVVDAVLIGLALYLIGVPLVLPLAVLTFFGAFFPFIGAIVAGAVAALVALFAGGVADALLVLGAVLVVQQLEGNVLYPLVMRRQVDLHPLVTLLAVTVGGVLAGILGAFLAVPVAAVVAAIGHELRVRSRRDRVVDVQSP